MPHHSPDLQNLLRAAQKAARGLVRDFGEVEQLQVSQKGPGDFVSQADMRAEEVIHRTLSEIYPNHSFLMEESGEIKGKDERYRIVVDPLDGTTNFLHGVPIFSVNLALEERNLKGEFEPIVAVTCCPLLGEIYYAEKGGGAWLERINGRTERLRVASRQTLAQSLLCVGSLKRHSDIAAILAPQCAASRALGATSIVLAYIAAGRLDMFVLRNPLRWDVSAGMLMIQEAGGVCVDFSGKKLKLSQELVACNDRLEAPIIQALKEVSHG